MSLLKVKQKRYSSCAVRKMLLIILQKETLECKICETVYIVDLNIFNSIVKCCSMRQCSFCDIVVGLEYLNLVPQTKVLHVRIFETIRCHTVN